MYTIFEIPAHRRDSRRSPMLPLVVSSTGYPRPLDVINLPTPRHTYLWISGNRTYCMPPSVTARRFTTLSTRMLNWISTTISSGLNLNLQAGNNGLISTSQELTSSHNVIRPVLAILSYCWLDPDSWSCALRLNAILYNWSYATFGAWLHPLCDQAIPYL